MGAVVRGSDGEGVGGEGVVEESGGFFSFSLFLFLWVLGFSLSRMAGLGFWGGTCLLM